MTEDYWEVEILSATLNGDKLTIRLEGSEGLDPENSVLELQIQSEGFPDNTLSSLTEYLFCHSEIFFQENESEKFLEINFDYYLESGLRINYSEITQTETNHTFDELKTKLKVQQERYFAQSNIQHQETRKLQKIVHQLKHEVLKELDRSERKSEFFAYTEKAIRFNERVLCYQKIYDWIALLEKEDAPKSN